MTNMAVKSINPQAWVEGMAMFIAAVSIFMAGIVAAKWIRYAQATKIMVMMESTTLMRAWIKEEFTSTNAGLTPKMLRKLRDAPGKLPDGPGFTFPRRWQARIMPDRSITGRHLCHVIVEIPNQRETGIV